MFASEAADKQNWGLGLGGGGGVVVVAYLAWRGVSAAIFLSILSSILKHKSKSGGSLDFEVSFPLPTDVFYFPCSLVTSFVKLHVVVDLVIIPNITVVILSTWRKEGRKEVIPKPMTKQKQ